MAECEYNEIIIDPPEWPDDYCIFPEGTLDISENGVVDIKEYEFVNVNVSINLQDKSVTPSGMAQTVTADQGYDGLGEVSVGAIPPEYIIPTGTKQITENGDGIDVSAFAAVDVNVSGGGAEDFVHVVEGTGTTYSNSDITKVKERVFYADKSVQSVDFPNATSIGDSVFFL